MNVSQPDRTNERGFTLVELMVVVAIIALLAAIIIPNYVHARAQASVSATEATMNQIASALELYHTDFEDYPSKSGIVDPSLFGGPNNKYLTTTPGNALGRKPYSYTYVATGAGGAGQPSSYTVTDSGPYDASTLGGLPKKGGGALCSTCTAVNYDPQDGMYGT